MLHSRAIAPREKGGAILNPTSAVSAREARLSRQVAWLEARLRRLRRRSGRLTWLRVWTFLGGGLLSLWVFLTRGTWPGLFATAIAAVLFGVVVALHRRLEVGIERHATWRAMRLEQRARLALDWDALPPPASARPAAEHPFGRDLDLAGPRSLLHRIDRCATADGSRRLRAWLLREDTAPEEALRRQVLLRAWTARRRLRDRLLLEARLAAAEAARRWSERGEVGEDGRWSVDASLAWLLGDGGEEARAVAGAAEEVAEAGTSREETGEETREGPGVAPAPRPRLFRWLLLLGSLVGAAWLLLVAERWLGLLSGWWQAVWLLYAALVLLAGRLTGDIFGEAMRLEGALRRLRAIFHLLEAHPADDEPELAALLAPFHDDRRRPSLELRRTVWVSAAASVRGNPLVWLLLNATLPWDFFFAWRLERLRGRLAAALPAWLEAWHSLEALDSFADLLGQDARWSLPELGMRAPAPKDPCPSGDPAAFEDSLFAAEGLAHPLLGPEVAVANDARLAGPGEIAIVTGSNMSGKSTYLRAIGVATALALAGGPVPARRMRLGPCRLFVVGRIATTRSRPGFPSSTARCVGWRPCSRRCAGPIRRGRRSCS